MGDVLLPYSGVLRVVPLCVTQSAAEVFEVNNSGAADLMYGGYLQ